jgi:hypothetical protein
LRFKTFILIQPDLEARAKLGKKTGCSFKNYLRKSGYSDKTAEEIWNWYTSPTKPMKK